MALAILLQCAVIILCARVAGWAFRRMRQPMIIGEMFAGIALGPSIAGALFPEQHAALFTTASRPALTLVGQAGVAIFMFIVGTRLKLDVFQRHSRPIAAIAAAAIVVPFALGTGLAFPLHAQFAAPLPRVTFVLFIATAMAVTAFPVLAGIILERGLDRTRVGSIALICAALNDAVAWLLVASITALVASGTTSVPPSVHGSLFAFLGGIVCGLVVPRITAVAALIEATAARFLLPVFFAVTGLRTDLRVLSVDAGSWLWCVAIVATATAGKFGGTAVAAMRVGLPRAEALTLGALMNTRGLMELAVLNIGYELGLLPPEVFAMMVVMTLVTTCAAGPLVDRWSTRYRSASAAVAP